MECVEQLTQNEAQHDAMNMCRLDLVTVGNCSCRIYIRLSIVPDIWSDELFIRSLCTINTSSKHKLVLLQLFDTFFKNCGKC